VSTRVAQLDERSSADALCIAVVALAAFRLLHQAVKLLVESDFIDLAYHYFHATMLRAGLDPFDPAHVAAARAADPLRHAGGEAVYTPGYFVLFQPLTWLPFRWVATLWLVLSLAIVVAAVAVVVRHAARPASWVTIAFATLLVAWYQPLQEDLFLGQNNTLLLGAAAVAWYAIGRDRPWLAGVAVGAMAFVKIPFAALVPLLVLLGLWRVALAAAVAWAVLFVMGLPQLGIDYYARYVAALARHTAVVAADVHNLSLNALWHRLLGGSPAHVVYLVTSLALVAGVVWRARTPAVDASPRTRVVLALTLIPLLSPHTEEHHLVVTLLPLLVAAFAIRDAGAGGRTAYVAALVLIASRYSWNRFAADHATVWTALLSAKVFGVLLLLGVLLHGVDGRRRA
jgi:hypothetical protein